MAIRRCPECYTAMPTEGPASRWEVCERCRERPGAAPLQQYRPGPGVIEASRRLTEAVRVAGDSLLRLMDAAQAQAEATQAFLDALELLPDGVIAGLGAMEPPPPASCPACHDEGVPGSHCDECGHAGPPEARSDASA